MTIELAQEWELFSGEKGVGAVARRIENKLQGEIKRAKKKMEKHHTDPKWLARQIFERMYKYMSQFDDYGATDTEPRYHLSQKINKGLGLDSWTDW